MRTIPFATRALVAASLLMTLGTTPIRAIPPELVADLGQDFSNASGSYPGGWLNLGERTLFSALPRRGAYRALYSTEGRPGDVQPLPIRCSDPLDYGAAEPLARLGVRGLILNCCAAQDSELWATDGSGEGTVRLPVPRPWSFGDGAAWVEWRSSLFALEGDQGPLELSGSADPIRLLRTDLTPDGTEVVMERPTFDGNGGFGLSPIAGGLIFFSLGSSFDSTRVWRTDGTTSGTRVLAVIPARIDSLTPAEPEGRFLLFTTRGGRALWSTDGTVEGTRPLREFETDGALAAPAFRVDNRFYFFAFEPVQWVLWETDGTPEGTKRRLELAPGFDPRPGAPAARVGGQLFTLIEAMPGSEAVLLRSPDDGSDPLYLPLGPGGCSQCAALAPLGDRVLFARSTEETGRELWSFGAEGEPELVVDACPGPCDGSPRELMLDGDVVLFVASDETWNSRLWRLDAGSGQAWPLTPAPLHVADLGNSERGLDAILALAAPAGVALFSASDGRFGVEPHAARLDGSGAWRLADLYWDRAGSDLYPLSGGAQADELVFTTREQLLRTRGAAGTTEPLLDLDGLSWYPREYYALGAHGLVVDDHHSPTEIWSLDAGRPGAAPLFGRDRPDRPDADEVLATDGRRAEIVVREPDGSAAIWQSDGSEAGTRHLLEMGERYVGWAAAVGERRLMELRNRHGGSAGLYGLDARSGALELLTPSDSSNLLAAGPDLGIILTRRDDAGGVAVLVASDGTRAGTREVARVEGVHALESWLPSRAAWLGSRALFRLGAGEGSQLWSSDGSAEGTARVDCGDAGESVDDAVALLSWNDRVLFACRDRQARHTLWATDGTPAGTARLDRLDALAPDTELHDLAVAGGRLVLLVHAPPPSGEGSWHWELWSTDGAPHRAAWFASPPLVPPSSGAIHLTTFAGRIFFVGATPEAGVELWSSDGTAAGTRLWLDLWPGPESGSPRSLAIAAGRLFFAGDDGIHGSELWSWDPADPAPCRAREDALCLRSGRYRVEAAWTSFDGAIGDGAAVPSSAESGAFSFFDASSPDLAAKVLDGRGVNGFDWVFHGALTNVRWQMTVRDTESGAARRYENPLGEYASGADTRAFAPLSTATVAPASSSSTPYSTTSGGGSCISSPTRLCLLDGRFAVEATWRDFDGGAGVAGAAPWPGGAAGSLWFFAEANVELLVKMVDGRELNEHFWFYSGALSNVEYTLTVTDTLSGAVRTYFNPAGTFASVGDVDAF